MTAMSRPYCPDGLAAADVPLRHAHADDRRLDGGKLPREGGDVLRGTPVMRST